MTLGNPANQILTNPLPEVLSPELQHHKWVPGTRFREVPHPFLQTTSCLIVDATSSRVIQETSVEPMGFGSNSSVLTMRKCCGR